jgi:hypothetical protein
MIMQEYHTSSTNASSSFFRIVNVRCSPTCPVHVFHPISHEMLPADLHELQYRFQVPFASSFIAFKRYGVVVTEERVCFPFVGRRR